MVEVRVEGKLKFKGDLITFECWPKLLCVWFTFNFCSQLAASRLDPDFFLTLLIERFVYIVFICISR